KRIKRENEKYYCVARTWSSDANSPWAALHSSRLTRKREGDKERKQENNKTRNIPSPLFDPPEARSKVCGASLAPTPPASPRRGRRVKGAARFARRHRR